MHPSLYDDIDEDEVRTSDEEFINDSENTDYDTSTSRSTKSSTSDSEKEVPRRKRHRRVISVNSDSDSEEEEERRHCNGRSKRRRRRASAKSTSSRILDSDDDDLSPHSGHLEESEKTEETATVADTENETIEDETVESETVEDDDDFLETTIPPISIFRIQSDNYIITSSQGDDSNVKAEEMLISKIMDHYGAKSNSQSIYERQSEKEMDLPEEYRQYFEKSDSKPFKTLLFVQPNRHAHPLLQYYESKLRSVKINIIWFMYRARGDIFALTTDNARHVVRDFCDFTFPAKIAARLGSLDGAKGKKQKVLVGNTHLVTKLMKVAQVDGQNSEQPLLCNNFEAALKPTASILRLAPFAQKNQPPPFCTFGFGSIRFERKVRIMDFQLILNHLSIIYRGQNTYELPLPQKEAAAASVRVKTEKNGKTKKRRRGRGSSSSSKKTKEDATVADNEDELPQVLETDSNVFMNNFIQVPTELAQKLDDTLIKLFRRELKARISRCKNGKPGGASAQSSSPQLGDFMSPLCCFDFCYKAPPQEFAAAGATQLAARCYMTFQSKNIQLPLYSSLNQLMDILAVDEDGDFSNLDLKDREQFRKQLTGKMRLCGQFIDSPSRRRRSSTHTPNMNLFSCLTGELIRRGTGDLYWRIQNLWCHVNPDYFMSVHRWFSRFLKDSHLSMDEHHLTLPWSRPSSGSPSARVQATVMTIDEDSDKELKEYLSLYVKKQRKAPDPREKGVEGFFYTPLAPTRFADLVHVDTDGEIMFYFVSTNFVTQTKYICQRIHYCREQILNADKASRSAIDPSPSKSTTSSRGTPNKGKAVGGGGFRIFYNKMVTTMQATELESGRGFWKWKSYEDFVESLTRATMVYALANTETHPQLKGLTFSSEEKTLLMLRESGLARQFRNYFEDDANFKDNEVMRTAVDFLIKSGEEDGELNSPTKRAKKLAELLMAKLKAQGYIRNDDLATAKLVYATLNTFDLQLSDSAVPRSNIPGLRMLTRQIFTFFSEFRPQLTLSLGARLELRELENQSKLDECRVKLKVCDILVEDKV